MCITPHLPLLQPHVLEAVRQAGDLDGVALVHVRPPGHDERFAHFLQRVRHGQAVLLEGLHRVMDAARDQIRVAAADVEMAGQVRGAVGGSRVRVGIRRRRPINLIPDDVGRRIFLRLLDVGELGDADGAHDGSSLGGIGVRGGAVEAVVEVEGVLALGTVLADLRLAVHERVGAAVGVRVADVEVPHGVALALRRRDHPEVLLPHDGLVIRRGAVGRRDQGAVPVGRHVVGPHEVTSCDAGVGRHGRGLQVVLRVVEGAGALGAVNAAVTDPAVVLVRRAVQTGLGMVVETVLVVDVKIICREHKRGVSVLIYYFHLVFFTNI